jgi:glycine betaine catabolism B
MTHQLAPRYDGSDQVDTEIAARPADDTDHVGVLHRTIATYHPDRLTLVVDAVIEETETSLTFRLVSTTGDELPPFLAGQYVNLYADGTSRPYAISSSPRDPSSPSSSFRASMPTRLSIDPPFPITIPF